MQSFPPVTAWRYNTASAASTPWLIIREAPLWSGRRTYTFIFIVLSTSKPQVLTPRAVGQITAPPPATTPSAVPMVRISRNSLNSLSSRSSHTWLVLTEMGKGASSKWLCWQLWRLVTSMWIWTSAGLRVVPSTGVAGPGRWCLATNCD